MLGTYRLCLALLVALSHIGVGIVGLNPGVIAVVGFYMVSGYVMTGLVRAHYGRLGLIAGFYRDRILRLYPHYLAIACITLAWFALSGARTDYLRALPTLENLAENVLVVPLNFYMFNHADAFTLIPPAWSLGAEIQFYILVPVVLLLGARSPVILASLTVFGIASLGLINTDWFGYRLLPGVLWMFLVGSLLFDAHQRPDGRRRGLLICSVVAALAGALAAALFATGSLMLRYNRETLIGLVCGVIVVHILAHRPRHRLDDMVGNLSYGVFLCHFLVMWTFFDGKVSGLLPTLAFLGLAMLIAFAMFAMVEQPVMRLRHRLRRAAENGRREMAKSPAQ